MGLSLASQLLFTWTVPLFCIESVNICFSEAMTGRRDVATYIEAVLGIDAFAIGGIWRDSTSYLIPTAKISFDLESNVRLWVKTSSIPE